MRLLLPYGFMNIIFSSPRVVLQLDYGGKERRYFNAASVGDYKIF